MRSQCFKTIIGVKKWLGNKVFGEKPVAAPSGEMGGLVPPLLLRPIFVNRAYPSIVFSGVGEGADVVFLLAYFFSCL